MADTEAPDIIEIRKFCPNASVVKTLGEQMETVVDNLFGTPHSDIDGNTVRNGGMKKELATAGETMIRVERKVDGLANGNGFKVKVRLSAPVWIAIITATGGVIAAIVGT